MRKEVKVSVAGRPYLIRQMAAREGFDYLDRCAQYEGDRLVAPSSHSVLELAQGVKASVGGQWVALDTPEVIDACVSDTSEVIPAHKVLGELYKRVNSVNFGFIVGRRQPVVPRRFRPGGGEPDKVDRIHPTISRLIASGKATMEQLESYYSVEDAITMADILVVEGVNEAKAHEAAMEKAKAKK